MRAREQLTVHASAAAGAHLEHEVGKPAADRILQAVEALVMCDQRILVVSAAGRPGAQPPAPRSALKSHFIQSTPTVERISA